MAENLSVARPLAQGLLQAFAQVGAALWRTARHSAPSQGSSSLVEAGKQTSNSWWEEQLVFWEAPGTNDALREAPGLGRRG